ncbi:fluoride efflux transporter CrcB [Pedobacter insulae]|uniref:Fluoride-specific ion channel FluC n=1 Tax=Pedobacter insulae TaxID=414048 RepID=A0A1I2YTM8_9SPHI|nr:fluoride efflux transporter CrcB [Pedobacter insulae]SFH28964.1 CrcB protein [Pedobacter insulae]
MIKQFVLVGLGGALGSMLRYGTSLLTSRYYVNIFPLATFIINILGCFLIGILLSYFSKNNSSGLQLLLITGFCGGYTTFSTFSAENIALWQSQHYLTLIAYTLGSIILGCLAVWLGLSLFIAKQ